MDQEQPSRIPVESSMVEGEAGSLGSNAAADRSGDPGRLTTSGEFSERPLDTAAGAGAANAPRSRGDTVAFEKLGVGDEDVLSFSYDGEEMEELEEEEVSQVSFQAVEGNT